VFDGKQEIPILAGECNECGLCLDVCPGKDIPIPNLEQHIFGRVRNEQEIYLGVWQRLNIGQACDAQIRKNGSGGGLVTALLCHAFERKEIDGAVVTIMDPDTPWLAKPKLADSARSIFNAAQSKYMVVPVNKILDQIIERNLRRVAVVGLPCHIHGLRKMSLHPALENLSNRIAMMIGIFCGANFSGRVIEHFITEVFGVDLDQIDSFQFRGGIDNREIILATKDNRQIKTEHANRIYLLAGHKKERCLMCADLYNDLADISVGDVFTYESHRAVSNVSSIIVRTEKGEKLLASSESANKIKCMIATPNVLYGNIGFERKIHGTAYRLDERMRFGWPVPDFGRPLSSNPQMILPYNLDLKGFQICE
jgi:coenzyme F420 hydrogenase subunit beta